jgi:hypothetical protein
LHSQGRSDKDHDVKSVEEAEEVKIAITKISIHPLHLMIYIEEAIVVKNDGEYQRAREEKQCLSTCL